MAITNVSVTNPAKGVLNFSGTFSTNAVAFTTTTTTNANAATQSQIAVAASAGMPGRYVTWPGGGIGGADAPVLVLGASTGTGMAIASPGLITGTPAGTILTRWEQVKFAGMPKKVTVTQSNGTKFEWNAGDAPFTITKTPNGGSAEVLNNAAVVTAESIQFSSGVLPDSADFTIDIVLVAN